MKSCAFDMRQLGVVGGGYVWQGKQRRRSQLGWWGWVGRLTGISTDELSTFLIVVGAQRG